MTTNVPSSQLELHFISAGIEESIIVHMPNDKWGVVDCCASSVADHTTNPTLQFLLEHQVKELEFLCLTHPHSDHYRVMSHLLNQFPTKYFWRFAGMTPDHLFNLLNYLKGDAQERSDDYDFESANDLQMTLHLVSQMRKQGLAVKHISGIKTLYPIPITLTERESLCDVEVVAIAPSSDHVEQYEYSLRACFTEDGRLKPDAPRLRHNDVSVALLIRYGCTRLVLGGDVEASNWRDTLSAIDNTELAADAVKVSHHGSTTGYTPNLWTVFSANGEPIAIITPFRRCRLPERGAVEHIKQHTSRLMTTCRPAVPFTTETSFDVWDNYPLQVHIALRGMFRSFHANRSSEMGVCSLAFDNRGNCTSVKSYGAAGRL